MAGEREYSFRHVLVCEVAYDELEAWFAPAASGARSWPTPPPSCSEPDHPAQAKIVQYRQALRQLLEDLAKSAGAYDPAVLAAQL